MTTTKTSAENTDCNIECLADGSLRPSELRQILIDDIKIDIDREFDREPLTSGDYSIDQGCRPMRD